MGQTIRMAGLMPGCQRHVTLYALFGLRLAGKHPLAAGQFFNLRIARMAEVGPGGQREVRGRIGGRYRLLEADAPGAAGPIGCAVASCYP